MSIIQYYTFTQNLSYEKTYLLKEITEFLSTG